MNRDTYCLQVCGGKCCTLYLPDEPPVRCPRQADNGSCSIYSIRYSAPLLQEDVVQVGQWKSVTGALKPFYCGHIEKVIAKGLLPKEIEDVCCYAHPELLELEEPCVTK